MGPEIPPVSGIREIPPPARQATAFRNPSGPAGPSAGFPRGPSGMAKQPSRISAQKNSREMETQQETAPNKSLRLVAKDGTPNRFHQARSITPPGANLQCHRLAG